MKKTILMKIAIFAVFALLIAVILIILGMFGVISVGKGCFFRYNYPTPGANSVNPVADNSTDLVDVITDSVSLSANGSNGDSDNLQYGQWTNTYMTVDAAQVINYDVSGELSMCRAYIPKNNLGSTNDVGNQNNKIPIPRVEDLGDPISIQFPANLGQWRNLTEIFNEDKIIVSVSKESQSNNSLLFNPFTGATDSADCRENKTTYSPICGKYSIYNYSGTYTSGCSSRVETQCTEWGCRYKLRSPLKDPTNWRHRSTRAEIEEECQEKNLPSNAYDLSIRCTKDKEVTVHITSNSSLPAQYKNDGTYTSPFYTSLSSLTLTSLRPTCPTTLPKTYFWYNPQPGGPTGLLYRFDGNENPTNKTKRGGNYRFAVFLPDQAFYDGDQYKIIYNNIYEGNRTYLQYRYHYDDDWNMDNVTGGYVLNIKHTKCRRNDGRGANDKYGSNRGAVEYLLTQSANPNNSNEGATGTLSVDAEGKGSLQIDSGLESPRNLWMRVKNVESQYADSIGNYNINFTSKRLVGSFDSIVSKPLIDGVKAAIENASELVFANMVCYGGGAGCTNFFNYIRIILTLYIIIYGIMYLLGLEEITTYDLAMRMVKIILVAGLLNESTFEFFRTYIFDLINNFSSQIIKSVTSISGYNGDSESHSPFIFVSEFMSKVFFSKGFLSQLLALITMNMGGIIYFVIVLIAIILCVIAIFRAMAIYLMALVGVAILLALSPIFLSFMLFDFTRHMFDSWINNIIRLTFEPIILLIGIIILSLLLTVYIDNILNFSTCWKCTLPFKIPFINMIDSIKGADLTNVPIFCINWYAPWGEDVGAQNGVSMSHIIILMMIAYCIHGYVELSTHFTNYIFHGTGAATTAGGQMFNDAANLAKAGGGYALKKAGQLLDNAPKEIGKSDSGAQERSTDKASSGQRNPISTDGSNDQFSIPGKK